MTADSNVEIRLTLNESEMPAYISSDCIIATYASKFIRLHPAPGNHPKLCNSAAEIPPKKKNRMTHIAGMIIQ
jgi:hypothetical protein